MAQFRTVSGGGSGIQITLGNNEDLIVADGLQVFSDDNSVIVGSGLNDILIGANSAIRTFSSSDPAIELADPNSGGSVEISLGATVSSSGTGIIGREGRVNISNYGAITAASVALDLFETSNDLTNFGSISGNNSGARVWQDSTITNFGDIYGEIFGAILREGGGEVSNAGTIQGDTAVWMGGDLSNTTANRLNNSGDILGLNYGVFTNFESATIVNSGTISNNRTVTAASAHRNSSAGELYSLTNSGTISSAVIAYDGAADTDTIINTGTILGDINTSTGADSIVNSGDITGSIALGDGADEFTNDGGHVSGSIEGGDGDDIYTIDQNTLQIIERAGEGTDRVNASVTYALDAEIEDLSLIGSADIKGIGNTLNNSISGNAGGNRLSGSTGNDTVSGRAGDDSLFGGGGNDSLSGDEGDDYLSAGAGSDELFGGDGDDVLLGRRGSDVLFGDDGADWLEGGNSNDTLQGGREDDTLVGGQGADKMNGGSGIDTFVWRAVGESPASGGHDTIFSYEVGTDVLDLQAFNIQEINILSGFSGGGTASIRTSETGAGTTRVFADVDGNSTADLRFDIADVTGLTGADFLL